MKQLSGDVFMKNNIGFDDRIFLKKEEWQTYLRRMPVRYIKKKKREICEICGKPPTKDNPFESSHIIGFRVGVDVFGLTPNFLDHDDNIVTAHKKLCNSKAEKSTQEVCRILQSLEVDKLPEFLPSEILVEWERTNS